MNFKNILPILLLATFISFPALAMEKMMGMDNDEMPMGKTMGMDNDEMPMGKSMSFKEKKAKHIKRIEKKIAALEKKKSCIKSSSDKATIKECKKQYKSMKSKYKKRGKNMMDNDKKSSPIHNKKKY